MPPAIHFWSHHGQILVAWQHNRRHLLFCSADSVGKQPPIYPIRPTVALVLAQPRWSKRTFVAPSYSELKHREGGAPLVLLFCMHGRRSRQSWSRQGTFSLLPSPQYGRRTLWALENLSKVVRATMDIARRMVMRSPCPEHRQRMRQYMPEQRALFSAGSSGRVTAIELLESRVGEDPPDCAYLRSFFFVADLLAPREESDRR
ncbi:hypothetical protein K474DRAFT_1673063 [Panus rudis PR-1116 ss-1]|nr:hypothetical protein K474DRAFT_1673063 [Panus rudis PR-1116 ss-1]